MAIGETAKFRHFFPEKDAEFAKFCAENC